MPPGNETTADRVTNAILGWFHRMFPAHSVAHGGLAFLLGALVISVVMFFLLQMLRPRGRKTLIVTVTFLAGLFYAVEFFWPVRIVNGTEANFLTPQLDTMNDISQVVSAIALGVGIYSLVMVHGRTLSRARSGWFYSLIFFLGLIAMAFIGIFSKMPGHTNPTNKVFNDILFVGGLQALDATMFSIVAFYIVSAAYRAFRIRTAEASLLMLSALIVMLGQVYAGQVLTAWLPRDGALANLRVESMSDWLLTTVNAPAVRAIGFGLGVGLLATALRIWLSLERGSYFDREV